MSWPGTSKPVFLPIHASFTAGYACFPVIYYQNTNVTTVVHGGQQVVSVSERITRLQANPTRAVALSKARQRVGKWLVQRAGSSLDNSYHKRLALVSPTKRLSQILIKKIYKEQESFFQFFS